MSATVPAWRKEHVAGRVASWILRILAGAVFLPPLLREYLPTYYTDLMKQFERDYGYAELATVVTVGVACTLVLHWDYRRRSIAFNLELIGKDEHFLPVSECLVLYLRSFDVATRASLRRVWIASWRHFKKEFWNGLTATRANNALRRFQTATSGREIMSGAGDPEQYLARIFQRDATFVAIGNKHDAGGALKIKVGDQAWKELFLRLAKRCQLILCFVGNTEASLWELATILQDPALRDKTFLFITEGVPVEQRALIRAKLSESGLILPDRLPSSWAMWASSTSSPNNSCSFEQLIDALADRASIPLTIDCLTPRNIWERAVAVRNSA